MLVELPLLNESGASVFINPRNVTHVMPWVEHENECLVYVTSHGSAIAVVGSVQQVAAALNHGRESGGDCGGSGVH